MATYLWSHNTGVYQTGLLTTE